jgi:hypothetical protein
MVLLPLCSQEGNRMNLLEVAYVELLEETWGNIYDKPYVRGSSVRHTIGRWSERSRWTHKGVPMISIFVVLDGKEPLVGWAKRRSDRDGAINIYARPDHWDRPAIYRMHGFKLSPSAAPNEFPL